MKTYEVLLHTGSTILIEADVMEIENDVLQFWIADERLVAFCAKGYWLYGRELDAPH